MRSSLVFFCVFLLAMFTSRVQAQNPHAVTYEGDGGPGVGKHIVFIAGDHEYRGEETCPALARILARHYGFKCTVLFTTDPQTGDILPGSSHISGLEVLANADLAVLFLRFQDFPEDQMQHFVNYVDSGRPLIGLRTSTHAFRIRRGRPFHAYSYDYSGEEFEKGFGRQILGETWVSHYGRNHVTSAAFLLDETQSAHPILRGVSDVWVRSGAYTADPIPGSTILARSRVLNGMSPDSPAAEGRGLQPAAWVRTHQSKSGKEGRVFTSTHGASEDILNDGFRRMLINACLWAVGLEEQIASDAQIGFVGPFRPSRFDFDGYRTGVKPSDLSGWDTPIMPGD